MNVDAGVAFSATAAVAASVDSTAVAASFDSIARRILAGLAFDFGIPAKLATV